MLYRKSYRGARTQPASKPARKVTGVEFVVADRSLYLYTYTTAQARAQNTFLRLAFWFRRPTLDPLGDAPRSAIWRTFRRSVAPHARPHRTRDPAGHTTRIETTPNTHSPRPLHRRHGTIGISGVCSWSVPVRWRPTAHVCLTATPLRAAQERSPLAVPRRRMGSPC